VHRRGVVDKSSPDLHQRPCVCRYDPHANAFNRMWRPAATFDHADRRVGEAPAHAAAAAAAAACVCLCSCI
jgi:hypothetical protein